MYAGYTLTSIGFLLACPSSPHQSDCLRLRPGISGLPHHPRGAVPDRGPAVSAVFRSGEIQIVARIVLISTIRRMGTLGRTTDFDATLDPHRGRQQTRSGIFLRSRFLQRPRSARSRKLVIRPGRLPSPAAAHVPDRPRSRFPDRHAGAPFPQRSVSAESRREFAPLIAMTGTCPNPRNCGHMVGSGLAKSRLFRVLTSAGSKSGPRGCPSVTIDGACQALPVGLAERRERRAAHRLFHQHGPSKFPGLGRPADRRGFLAPARRLRRPARHR